MGGPALPVGAGSETGPLRKIPPNSRSLSPRAQGLRNQSGSVSILMSDFPDIECWLVEEPRLDLHPEVAMLGWDTERDGEDLPRPGW